MLSFISWNFDPVIFELHIAGHSWPLRWYGVVFASGFIVAQQVLYYIFAEDNKPRRSVDVLTVYFVIATIVGARLGHYLFYEWPLLLENPVHWFVSMITPPFAGLASHGATIAILFAVYLYSRNYSGQSYFWILDRLVIVAPIGGAMIRLGNLLNSEIYGIPTSLPWGFEFVRETDPALLPIVPRHPTQLYEAMFCLFLFGLTFFLWKRYRNQMPEGVITGVFIVLLFASRFAIEFVKNNQVAFEDALTLNLGQVLSLPMIFTGIVIIILAFRHPQNTASQTE